MADIIDILVAGGAVFFVSFFVLLALWSVFVRMLFTALGRSQLFFLPKTLKELFLSMAFILLLLSLQIAAYFTDRALLGGEMLKIWQILLIFAVANVIVRVLLTGLDVQHRKAKDRSGLYRSIGLLKGTIGLVLYLIALMISVYVLSTELGAAVMVIGFFIIVLVFAAGFSQMKSIVAGLQLGDYYVDVGSLVTIDGERGFVEAVHGRSTVMRTPDGRTVVVPNFHFFEKRFEIDNGESTEMSLLLEIDGKEPAKMRERISAVSSKMAIGLQEISSEFKPRAFYTGVKGGRHTFSLSFRVVPGSDVRKALDALCSSLQAEFRERVSEMRLEPAKP